MMTNKWIQFGMNGLIVLFSWMAAADWTTLVSPSTGAIIAGVIGLGKMALNTMLPAAGQTMAPTGGTIITHN